MNGLTPEQQAAVAPAAAFVAVGAVATAMVDWRTGLMAALLAAAMMLVPAGLAGIVPRPYMNQVRFALRPLAIAALLVVVPNFSYLITPGFLAPQLPLAAVAGNLDAYAGRRLVLEGTFHAGELLPFGIGNDTIMLLRVGDEGKDLAAYYAIAAGERLPSEGARIRMQGVVETYGGGKLHFVARTLEAAR
jgi:hypothetical protein